MKLREASPSLDCEHLAQRVATLEDKLLQAMERIAKLEEENAGLQQQLAAARKDSSTSSKPPSSDIVKPKKPLPKLIGKVSKSLAPAYAELFERLPGEAVLNIDETGHKENGQRFWTWCFRAQLYTLFRIDKSRGSKVLVEVLGVEFNGVLGCDYFSAYRKYMRECDVLVQFCMAHLIRDVKFLLTLPGREVQAYGQRLRDALRELFGVIHRREKMTATAFQKALETAREQLMKAATTRVPATNHARNLAKRFREHGDAYFRFITTPGIEPTNNLAEQAIRFVVIDRRITQGTRSETGRRWCERISTVIATCAQQGRSVFTFILDSVHAHFGGGSPPSLLPSGP
jgi:transposase